MSIYAVARDAGVSTATVSRFINKTGRLSKDKAKKVLKAMNRLGYVPSEVRPGPKLRRHNLVRHGRILMLSLLPYDPFDLYRMPTFPALIGGIQKALAESNFGLMVTQWQGDYESFVPNIRNSVDGVILIGNLPPSAPVKLIDFLLAVPTVLTFKSESDPDGRFDHVYYDNRFIGEMAFRYLSGAGCRNTAVVVHNKGHVSLMQRMENFLGTAADEGMKATAIGADAELDGGSLFERMDKAADIIVGMSKVDGIFVTSDDALLALSNCLKARGIEPERDIRTIGCNNDNNFLGQLKHRPATIDLKLEEVGRKTVEQLFSRMKNPGDESRMDIFVKPVMVPALGKKKVKS
ncbi:MAG TPA: hypothetical protein DET40_16690 [Lentisphaeria bacterium]|nr:MAG: hypothetical protein A2X45_13055 [Lentisphaerae bacterium GWF2_50_93]HCE45178.1 hypothetical protein [Lentisphaeria bacterium]